MSSVEAWFGPRSHSISKNKIEQNFAWVKNKIIHTIIHMDTLSRPYREKKGKQLENLSLNPKFGDMRRL